MGSECPVERRDPGRLQAGDLLHVHVRRHLVVRALDRGTLPIDRTVARK